MNKELYGDEENRKSGDMGVKKSKIRGGSSEKGTEYAKNLRFYVYVGVIDSIP